MKAFGLTRPRPAILASSILPHHPRPPSSPFRRTRWPQQTQISLVKGRRHELISLIVTTHESVESDVFKAVGEIDRGPSLVEGESRVIRIEDINGELW